MRKIVFAVPLLALTLAFLLVSLFPSGLSAAPLSVRAESVREIEESVSSRFEEKEFSRATLEDEFAGDSVIVVMDKSISAINKTHSSRFFGNFEKEAIKDLTALDESAKRNVDENEFRQVFQIKLPTDCKEAVLKTIKQLEGIEGVKHAGPDYPLYLCATPNDDPRYNDQWNHHGVNGISAPAA